MTLATWTASGFSEPGVVAEIDHLRGMGVDTVVFLVTAYQDSPRSGIVTPDSIRTPTPESVALAVGYAQSLGLSPMLKLHVDLEDGRWRGAIEPEEPASWFRSYEAFLLPWVEFAEVNSMPLFVVGTELAGTLEHEARWRSVIRKVRERYSGMLTYAASWDEAARVPFWESLDLVGVDFYFPVADRADPGRVEILAGWQPWLDRMNHLHRQTGRDILLTEIGYRSVDGAGLHPYSLDRDAPIDLEEQGDLYWAALQAVSDKTWIAGLLWWNWLADGGGGPENRDYTAKGKPAEVELSRFWKGSLE